MLFPGDNHVVWSKWYMKYWHFVFFFNLQNENVDRDVYTTKQYQSIKRPDRVAPFRVLKPKTYFFKDNIWATFFTFNW